MKRIQLIFPHQLFEDVNWLDKKDEVWLIEEYLFFSQYAFHKQKIAFHRASMKVYEAFLKQKKFTVRYIEAGDASADIRDLNALLKKEKITEVKCIDPTDYWLEKRLKKACAKVSLKMHSNLLFINDIEDLETYFNSAKKPFFQTSFYIHQRKKLNILLEGDDKPLGGKWSYDADNRKKYPKGKTPPSINFASKGKYYKEAIAYTEENFSDNPGSLEEVYYPISFKDAKQWLNDFLTYRFAEFGPYEDAIVAEQLILNHSVLTPLLNVGLLRPEFIIKESLSFAAANDIPLNSLEGFIRQIIGWREFIRAVYHYKGREQRIKNHWKFDRKIPASFYDGTTGIDPIDITIKKVLKTGYCHHIERLMVLGNFMLLCEFDPDEVYRWFMELFIDAYDWVMVPNVYGMSQFADGGILATKPYISGSNYLKKMSNYKKGDWTDVWDTLFWRFMHVHRDFFLKNPRLGMLVRMFDKRDAAQRNELLERAEKYLERL